jgi:hypothetical protein
MTGIGCVAPCKTQGSGSAGTPTGTLLDTVVEPTEIAALTVRLWLPSGFCAAVASSERHAAGVPSIVSGAHWLTPLAFAFVGATPVAATTKQAPTPTR